MPGFDGSGPQGLGPMTGGARGFCLDPAVAVPARGMGFGRGRRAGGGFRRGMGMRQFAAGGRGFIPDAGFSRKEMLEQQVRNLESQLSYLKNSMSALDDDPAGGNDPADKG